MSVRPALEQALTEGLDLGLVRVDRLRPDGLALAGWSLPHGRAALLVDGKLRARATSEDEVEALARRVTEILGLGLLPR